MKLPLRSAAPATALALGSLLSAGALGCSSAESAAPRDGAAGGTAGAFYSGLTGGQPGSGGGMGSGGVPMGRAGTGGALNTGGASSPGNGGTPNLGGMTGTGGLPGSGGANGRTPPGGPGPVGQHGALHVVGNRVVDYADAPIQLRGMSLFWSQWSDYYSANTVDQLADDWRATIVRAALGVENDGYLQNPSDNERKVVSVVDRAVERGLYVIIDWHDHHAQDHQAQAVDFFTRMAQRYASAPGVIFEIYNEPLDVRWSTIKTYAETVVGAIRGAGAENLVVVGTPNWSQDVDSAAADPITAYHDVAYTLHFYAATHKQPLRDKATQALNAGLPLFVTEWGTCESTGNGTLDEGETRTWLGFLSQNQISWANWSLGDKDETCSALTPNAGTGGPWTNGKLTRSGALVKSLIP